MAMRHDLAFLTAMVAMLVGAARAAGDVVAVSPDGLWSILDRMPPQVVAAEPWIRPQKFAPVHLEGRTLTGLLMQAPLEFTAAAAQPITMTLPTPDGGFAWFQVIESPIMEPELQARFPEIRTYLGQGVDDRFATVRFDWTPQGFHAQVLSPGGAWYIDPFSRGETAHYASYYKKDLERTQFWTCGTHGELPFQDFVDAPLGDQLRTYRMACAATGEYTAFHGGTVTAGLSAIVTAMNRINGVYEREVAIRMVLVANNNLIVYTNASSDPYTNNNGSTMLNQNQSTLDSVIGSANYDIGHVFSTGGGGVAQLGCVCVGGSKAKGVTGSSSPTGDPFYIDYVAHEIGHQFGASHTFNSTSGGCNGNRASTSAYEPGSGSTIMAYAGLCSPDNLQSLSDAYFHTRSFDQIRAFTITGSGAACRVQTATGNNYPTVSAGPAYTIPHSTPFTLSASAQDPNGDPLTYSWEQYNLGPALTLAAGDNGSSPIIRSYPASPSPQRTIPRLANLLNNTFAVGERLPTTTRTLTFRITARDNRAGGGGIDWASTTINVTAAAGPFAVTSPNTSVAWSGAQTVMWNVAATNVSPVSTANVSILLSTDGGNTFPTTLLASTPNTGSALVTLPNITTSQARIKVAAVNNIYFDISNVNFSISPVAATVPNNTCATALPLPLGATPFSSTGATTTGFAEPGCAFCCADQQVNRDIWYTFVAPCTGRSTISLCGSSFSTRIAIYAGAACPTGTGMAAACNEFFCSSQSQVSFDTVAGAVYKVRIGGLGSQMGAGTITASCAGCYANCDNSSAPPILNVDDFTCFINAFAQASGLPHAQQVTHYANCDQSTTPPALNVDDFTCFINRFAQGCP
jgi:hypothetical protein